MIITTPKDRVGNNLIYVVQEAIRCGMTPTEFRHVLRDCWRETLEDMIKDADEDFKRELK